MGKLSANSRKEERNFREVAQGNVLKRTSCLQTLSSCVLNKYYVIRLVHLHWTLSSVPRGTKGHKDFLELLFRKPSPLESNNVH